MKTKARISLILPALLAVVLNSCENNLSCLRGNGILEEETRELQYYDGVVTEGEYEVFYVPDTASFVVMKTDQNLLPYIRTSISGNTLIVDNGTRKCLRSEYPLQIIVHTPEINLMRLEGSGLIYADAVVGDELRLEIEGSGVIDVKGIDVDELKVIITGSGDVDLWGKTVSAIYTITGSGTISADNVLSNTCTTEISGSGRIYCHAFEKLNVFISGSGDIFYKGSPSISTNISGTGNVISIDK